jgi:uncharacterized protein
MAAIDIDAHYNPPADWLEQFDAGLAARVPQFDRMEVFFELLYGDVLMASVPKSFKAQAIEAFARGVSDPDNADMAAAATDAEANRPEAAPMSERLAWMDAVGIESQFVLFSDFNLYKAAVRSGDRALGFDVLRAGNTWVADVCEGHSDRLIPITLIDFADVEWAVEELTRMRHRGSRVFHTKFEPVDGKSLAHPDVDRIWAAANDLGMILQIHIGGAQPIQNPGWFVMGDDAPFTTITRIAQMQAHSGVQMGLAALIHSGVFERHPRLGVVTAELDIRWVPHFLEILDGILVDEKWLTQGFLPQDYTYSMLPSEFAQQHLRVTPLAAPTQTPRKLLDDERTRGMVAFSTDFCHFEGTGKDGPAWYDDVLDGYGDDTKHHFFEGAMRELFDRASGLAHV